LRDGKVIYDFSRYGRQAAERACTGRAGRDRLLTTPAEDNEDGRSQAVRFRSDPARAEAGQEKVLTLLKQGAPVLEGPVSKVAR
jgi:hypothetical protein